MRQRDDIEAELVVVTATLHDLAICGIAVENIKEMQHLIDQINRLNEEARDHVPKIVIFPNR